MGVAAAQVGLDHQVSHLLGVARRKPGSFECAPNESRKHPRRGARRLGRAIQLLVGRIWLGHCAPFLTGCAMRQVAP